MKMKKFINAPETITDEELTGLGLAYPDILDVDGHLVISKDLADADRVTIVTYGGSGHEPAQAGFVGKGMLDVQAVGDIFAAPNAKLVFEAMKRPHAAHGGEKRAHLFNFRSGEQFPRVRPADGFFRPLHGGQGRRAEDFQHFSGLCGIGEMPAQADFIPFGFQFQRLFGRGLRHRQPGKAF